MRTSVIEIMDEFSWDVEYLCQAIIEEREKVVEVETEYEKVSKDLSEQIESLEAMVSDLQSQLDEAKATPIHNPTTI